MAPLTTLLVYGALFLLAPSGYARPAIATSQSINPAVLLANVHRLGEAYLNPAPIANAGVWEGFSDDVVGRVDVTNEYDGAELNTEYIFGVFGYQGSINTTRLVPVARDTKIIALTLTESIVSWSLIAEYDYGVDGMPYQPIQIDAWLKYDPSNPTKMTAYDFTFRRYAWSVQEAFPYLLKPIANELGYSVEEGDNGDRTVSMTAGRFRKGEQILSSSNLIKMRAAVDTCEVAMAYCLRSNKQYDDFDGCVNFLMTERELGDPWALGQDTTFCRYIHRAMVLTRPDVHCVHVGPSGGDMCVEREYASEVRNPGFQNVFVPSFLQQPELVLQD